VVLGPDPSIGEEFDIDVSFTELDQAWYAVGFQIRLKYDPTLLAKVSVTEGEFLTDPTWNLHGYWFYSSVQTPTPSIPHHHLLVAGLILPNASGVYTQTVFPHTSVLRMFTVRFRAIKQIKSCEPGNLSCVLGIFPMWPPTPDQWVLDRTGKYVGATTVNGTYTILNDITLGRIIDVYTQWPAPYGGQGWNRTSDMFWPQKEVILCANVTYNCWPVQQKLVTFVVWDPQMKVWTVLQAVTDENGVACVSFRIPWPCDDPESLFGVWRVRADVDIACIVVEDWVYFHFDYLINIISVETDKYQYKHCEFVDVTVTFTSHAQQQRHIAIWVTIHDELNVPVATQELVFWVGSAQWCTPKEYTKEFRLHIEKFVFAGYATVHVVSRFELLPGVWTAAGPEDTAIIFVLPE